MRNIGLELVHEENEDMDVFHIPANQFHYGINTTDGDWRLELYYSLLVLFVADLPRGHRITSKYTQSDSAIKEPYYLQDISSLEQMMAYAFQKETEGSV